MPLRALPGVIMPGKTSRIAGQRVFGIQPVMVHWIAFDEETAEAILNRASCGAAEIKQGDALATALALHSDSVVFLPSAVSGQVLLAHVRHPKPSSKQASPQLAYEPGGFLGLSDMPVFEPEPEVATPARKKWWQRYRNRRRTVPPETLS